jgi:phage terminase large subunit
VLLPMTTAKGHRTRFRVLYGGRDGAKSHSIARMLLARGMAKQERILCSREVQKSIADSVHKLLSDLIVALDIGSFYDVKQTAIVGANGTEFSFHGLSSETRDSLKSKEGTSICWVEEAQTISKKSLDILEPTIRAKDSEIWMSFNPILDSDEVYRRFVMNPPDDAIVGKIGWEDNPWRSTVLDMAREKMRLEAPEDYANIYGGECRSSVEGAIYAKEVAALYESGRVRPCPYDPLLPVHTVWDLGWNDQTSIALVQRASEIRIIGYIEDSHRTLAEYVAQLKAMPYVWGDDWLPHDGRAKDFKSGKSAEEIMRSLGRSPRIVESLDVESGIKAARMIFPRVYIDPSAERLLHCLKRYRRTINQSTNEPGPPLHDDASHGADAFRYLAVCVDQMGNTPTIVDPYKAFARRAYG